MDLYAYAKIPELGEIARKNGIDIPRLRGYRLMKDESKEDIEDIVKSNNIDILCCEELCFSYPFWNPRSRASEYSWRTRKKARKYINNFRKARKFVDNFRKDEEKVRWDKIHGWKRRTLKTAIHNRKRRIEKQYEVWNKYAGRNDILYIHARIGGGNWPYYYKQIVDQPWFLEKVDDWFDKTYCDIYAKIEEV